MRYNLRATAMAPQVVMAKKLFNLEKMRRRKRGLKEPNKHYTLDIDRSTLLLSFLKPWMNFQSPILSLTLLGLGLIKINTVTANFNNPRPSFLSNNYITEFTRPQLPAEAEVKVLTYVIYITTRKFSHESSSNVNHQNGTKLFFEKFRCIATQN